MSETLTQAESFSKYGKTFQERVVQALLLDHKWAEQVAEVMQPSYFDLKYLSMLARICFEYGKKYRAFPTFPILVSIVKDELQHSSDAALRQQVIDYLTKIKSDTDLGDIPYVKEKSLDFCKKQALKGAIEKSIELMSSDSYDNVVEVVKRAVASCASSTVGHDFLNEPDARFTVRNRNPVATGLSKLDMKSVLSGGVGRGELAVVCAPTGVGKSHFLTMIGANAMRSGKNVIHYTLEMSESLVGLRYDSNLCDIDSDDLANRKDEVVAQYKQMRLGRLFIKEFPTCWATINHVRSHVEKLAARGFKPDLIVIDYADIMRSTRQYDAKRFELQLIYQELRAYASEIDVPIWTASQSNKDGSSADVVDLNNMSEAYSKAMEADIVVSLSRKSHEKALGVGRLFLAKNRAGRDGLLFNMRVNTARSTFSILEYAESHSTDERAQAQQQDDTDASKAKLRARLRELSSEEALSGTTQGKN